ncbi:hypothetical protein A9D12_07510 [Erythrobacter neustonensis]|uniref:Uncharacterized protein n=1 Tax=Erythrobacter neustonensis TaxID=1112 RepID=A0A192D4J6_9SPHN|nr:hypothetical protein A9D12_07510 [Erythrobacter neustonensis]
MPGAINTAWEDVIVHAAAPALKPGQQTGAGIRQNLELDRTSCFLLHHDCARSGWPSVDNVADLHSHKVAAAQFAVYGKVKQRTITQEAAFVEVKSDLTYLPRL